MELDTHYIGPNINLKGLREVVTTKSANAWKYRYTSHGGTDPGLINHQKYCGIIFVLGGSMLVDFVVYSHP